MQLTTGYADAALGEQLLGWLDGLRLAIAQAGAYLQERQRRLLLGDARACKFRCRQRQIVGDDDGGWSRRSLFKIGRRHETPIQQ